MGGAPAAMTGAVDGIADVDEETAGEALVVVREAEEVEEEEAAAAATALSTTAATPAKPGSVSSESSTSSPDFSNHVWMDRIIDTIQSRASCFNVTSCCSLIQFSESHRPCATFSNITTRC